MSDEITTIDPDDLIDTMSDDDEVFDATEETDLDEPIYSIELFIEGGEDGNPTSQTFEGSTPEEAEAEARAFFAKTGGEYPFADDDSIEFSDEED